MAAPAPSAGGAAAAAPAEGGGRDGLGGDAWPAGGYSFVILIPSLGQVRIFQRRSTMLYYAQLVPTAILREREPADEMIEVPLPPARYAIPAPAALRSLYPPRGVQPLSPSLSHTHTPHTRAFPPTHTTSDLIV